MSQRSKQAPTNWHAYEHGRASSFGSLESVPENGQTDELSSSAPGHRQSRDENNNQTLRRKSSLGRRFDSLRQMGGPNSIENFAKSFQRAAGFRDITPVRRNSVHLTGDEEDSGAQNGEQSTMPPNRSLLRQQLQRYDLDSDANSAVQDEQNTDGVPNEESRLLPQPSRQTLKSTSGSIFSESARIPSQIGTSYGSISSRLTVTARQRASILMMVQDEASRRAMEQPAEIKEEEEPPRHFEREVLPDGEVIERYVGESTVPMTIFNSTNVLIGVGILALPLGLRYSGWVIGITLLSLAAASTAYTALLLAKCLDTNTACTTYGDIAFLAFGSWGRNSVESLFILELLAANVALVILFGDTMSSLLPQLSVLQWKALISLGLIPLNFVPFKALSFSSVVGIFCCLGIIIIVFTDGLIKPHSPGSLRDVAITWAFPEDWRTIPLSLGLFLAPWGGHSVFPAIYKDMRHPQKYQRAVKYTYIFTYGLDMTMAVLGYLMFGDRTRDEITANILSSTFYPRPLSILITVLISIIPVTKIPLTNRPIMDTVNKKFYIDLRQMDPKARLHSEKSLKHRLGRGSICVLANVAQLGLAILIPDFDSIMALMGSAFCFTICIILPVTFYLKIFNSDDQGISKAERILCWCLALVSTVLATIGTVFAVLPKHKIGASG